MEKEGKKHPRVCSRGGTEPDFLLQWGNRKRLRCVKIQGKGDSTEKTTIRVDRRIVRADKESSPGHNHLLRNSEATGDMKAQNSVHSSSPVNAEERFRPAKANGDNKQSTKDRGGNSGSSGTIQEKKGSSGSEGVTWPKFIIALTTKEKEDDFMAIRGSKPPLRPKKRAKFIQRSLNLVSPGSWLCDLTQERYEVREKKISKKVSLRSSNLFNLFTRSQVFLLELIELNNIYPPRTRVHAQLHTHWLFLLCMHLFTSTSVIFKLSKLYKVVFPFFWMEGFVVQQMSSKRWHWVLLAYLLEGRFCSLWLVKARPQ